jgi:hypothetical protein
VIVMSRTDAPAPGVPMHRQTDRQIVLYFSNNTQYTIALFCSETGLH